MNAFVVLLACWLSCAAAAASPTPSSDNEDAKNHWIWVHGVLMSLAWVGLLPVGALLAQSRWASPLRAPIGSKAAWYRLHLVLQLCGVALAIAGFGVAYGPASHMDIQADDGAHAYAHKVLGSIAFALLLAQAVLAFLRPHHGRGARPAWNALHHNLGRLALLTAWCVIWLGVAWWHEDEGQMRLVDWVAPLAVFQSVLLAAYIAGLAVRTAREPAAPVAAPEEPIDKLRGAAPTANVAATV